MSSNGLQKSGQSPAIPVACLVVITLTAARVPAASSFVNIETPHVHPADLSPDGRTLAVCNLPDNRLELFDVQTGMPVSRGAVPVGLDPVSVRFRSNTEAWVVNQVSDSISIVDLSAMRVVATLHTLDEPADVVFAGSPSRAFVTCSQRNAVQIFDPITRTLTQTLPIDGEDPRALAVSADGGEVYVAIFESGNRSTILGGGSEPSNVISFPPNVVSDPQGPYGGINPPPNAGIAFDPPLNPANPPPPRVGLIVKRDDAGRWMDDNGGDWTEFVTGAKAPQSGRPVGWQLVDHDLAIIDTDTLSVRYVGGLMNICMALAVNPGDGRVSVIGTDATNNIRYEPVLTGRFLRVLLGIVSPVDPIAPAVTDLNPHLDYLASRIPQAQRDRSIGDPRGMVWNRAGTRAYITGMGSNNVVVVGAGGQRAGLAPTIEVGAGPTGLVLDEDRSRLYVLNRFDGSISVVDTATESELARVPFFDPTPAAIKVGRKHLYDTRKNSGLGQIACGSCHVDARTDRLSWDLGDPGGTVKSTFGQNLGAGIIGLTTGFDDFHPMKGPMTTQTLQDIIGKEPHHWRGDRDGIEEFAGAFIGLQGDDETLTPVEMQEFEDFLATLTIPPNPNRTIDNALTTNLPLAGHFTTGRFAPAGQPLPNGNAQRGLELYRSATRRIDQGAFSCVTCHTLPIGSGTNSVFSFTTFQFEPIAPGPNGERHHHLVSVDGSTNRAIKVPQLRTLFDKVGFEMTQLSSRAGFGFLHDGSVDSLARFLSEGAFDVQSDQEVADLVALMLSFSGSGFGPDLSGEPPGTPSNDLHAAVGTQITIAAAAPVAQIDRLIALAVDSGRVDLVVRGVQDGLNRGWVYDRQAGRFQSDRDDESIAAADLRGLAGPGAEQTYTVVPRGTGVRIGVDRDEDGFGDRTEREANSDPADATVRPGDFDLADFDRDGDVDLADYMLLMQCFTGPGVPVPPACAGTDLDHDGDTDLADLIRFQNTFTGSL